MVFVSSDVITNKKHDVDKVCSVPGGVSFKNFYLISPKNQYISASICQSH